MFTIEEIKAAHGKVKSGADFPAYVQELIGLGMYRYEHFLRDGHITYYGIDGFVLPGDAKWDNRHIGDAVDSDRFILLLKEHQQGKSDYSTFCIQAAQCGVEKWIVDMEKMTCTYYDKETRELLVEKIPHI